MESEDYVFLWKWRKYLLLLATLVASVTYVAGLNPPGGVWPDDDNEGHHIGDPLLPFTYYPRYTAFFYCNAAAFVASVVIIMILLDRRVSGNRVGLTVLRSAMVLDLLALIGAYAAGSCRDVLASIYVSVLFAVVFAYVVLHILVAKSALPPVEWLRASLHDLTTKLEELLKKGDTNQDESRVEEDSQERRKFLLLLATFATPLTYGAGLAPPGGFWDKNDDRHRAGVPVLHDGRYARRYQAFFYCNATSFVASLAIIMLLMSRTLSGRVARSYALQVCVMVELLGLVGAYAAGSCRKVETTVYLVSLAGMVLLCIALQMIIGMFAMGTIKKWLVGLCEILQCRCIMEQEQLHVTNRDEPLRLEEMIPNPATPNTRSDAPEEDVTGVDGNEGDADTVEESRSLLLLLATLAATVTYQAGLNPPGGFWPEAGEDHRAGDPVLLQMHPKRYKAFYHCNTAAFVASLVVIVIVQSKQLSSGAVVKRRALQAAMTLDLFGLMGAYAAGSCRDVPTTIYITALAIAVFAYSMANVVAFTALGQRRESKLMLWVDGTVQKVLENLHLSDGHSETDDDLERKRKFLLQLAILAATVTYQTGLTQPGGFWPESDADDIRHAGDPVLLDHYRNRYLVFFYCNATGFMASVAVILLLVNRRLYKQGIRCNALHACVMVGLLGLMGAYAAGSCRKLRTSIYVFALVAAVIAFLVLQILLFVFARHVVLPTLKHQLPPWLPRLFEPLSPPPRKPDDCKSKDSGQHTEQYMKRKYLMLLGILAASVTYQAGLAPPGGTWGDVDSDNDKGYVAGNPILRDTYGPRYHAFFHCNATSFVSSVVVIVLLLQRTVKRHSAPLWAMQTAVVLDLLGLLGAYAAGSCRELETSAYVIALVVAVVVYITLHVVLSFDAVARKAEKLKVWKYCGGSTDQLRGNGALV